MKIKTVLLISILGLLPYSEYVLSEGINQQLPGMGAKAGAKVARFKADLEVLSNTGPKTGAAKAANCGSVAIGNVRSNGMNAPREVTTIVTGDVINVANGNCR